MNSMASPSQQARNRYNSSFNSKIFEPLGSNDKQNFIPAGKRRDQTTSELFGNYNDKDLKSCPKTFVPKDDGRTAREKKLAFLSSDVLPNTKYMEKEQVYRGGQQYEDPMMEADCEETIDPLMRRQTELSSDLFGRETPYCDPEEVHDRSKKLTPTDFKWFNMPEGIHSPTEGEDVTYQNRSYHEKCSNQVFEHQSPQERARHTEASTQQRQQENLSEAKRRANVYYSDLFGRNTPMENPDTMVSERRPKHVGAVEDQIVVHQDWTDSKTELMHRGVRKDDASAEERKFDEFNQTRLFGRGPGGYPIQPDTEPAAFAPQNLYPVTHDNSSKLRDALGHGTQQIHQAHLRTSMTPDEFYEEALNTKHWEVVELHLSGLPDDADEKQVRDIVTGFDLQIVKVQVEMDPVRNLCKGRAKVMVRYNPMRDSIAGLVRHLEAARLTVQL